MQSELTRGQIRVKKSSIHGYGVFAEQDFNPGDVIEECYTLEFDFDLDPDILTNHLFTGAKGNRVLPLGFGIIYNHSDTPNMHWDHLSDHAITVMRAIKKIKKGDEILHSYGKGWFQDRNIRQRESIQFRIRKFFPTLMLLIRFTIILALLCGLVATLNVLAT